MELAQLGSYGSVTEAELVKARLEANGIDSVVQADNVGGTVPTLAFTRRVKVFVRDTDLAEAYEVLERMLPG